MDSDYAIYADWIKKWRKWKTAWCDSDDPLLNYRLSFISHKHSYEPRHHAELHNQLCTIFPRVKMDKQGVIEVFTQTASKTIQVADIDSRFGIVTLRLDLFTRPEILMVGLGIKAAGHRLLYNENNILSMSILPCRDDPIWSTVE